MQLNYALELNEMRDLFLKIAEFFIMLPWWQNLAVVKAAIPGFLLEASGGSDLNLEILQLL